MIWCLSRASIIGLIVYTGTGSFAWGIAGLFIGYAWSLLRTETEEP